MTAIERLAEGLRAFHEMYPGQALIAIPNDAGSFELYQVDPAEARSVLKPVEDKGETSNG